MQAQPRSAIHEHGIIARLEPRGAHADRRKLPPLDARLERSRIGPRPVNTIASFTSLGQSAPGAPEGLRSKSKSSSGVRTRGTHHQRHARGGNDALRCQRGPQRRRGIRPDDRTPATAGRITPWPSRRTREAAIGERVRHGEMRIGASSPSLLAATAERAHRARCDSRSRMAAGVGEVVPIDDQSRLLATAPRSRPQEVGTAGGFWTRMVSGFGMRSRVINKRRACLRRERPRATRTGGRHRGPRSIAGVGKPMSWIRDSAATTEWSGAPSNPIRSTSWPPPATRRGTASEGCGQHLRAR